MSRRLGRNKIFQKFLNGTLTDADLLASGHLTDIHHRKSRGQGGNNKKSNKNKVSALESPNLALFYKKFHIGGSCG